ncbi:MAG: hypothetical protein ABI210_10380 [Abditibacteriaceae bacterium]
MMKLRYSILLLLMTTTVGLFSTQGRAADKPESDASRLSNSLTVEVNSERPSNVFWDSETMDTHKPILLSWRVDSAISGMSRVQVQWRLLDANGKRVLDGSQKYDITSGSYAAGRQLFSPKKRGAYLWVVRATIKLNGPDLVKIASIPLAVIAAPQNLSTPFLFCNDAPTDPASSDFYQRVGTSAGAVSPALQFPIPEGNVNAAARRRVIWFGKSQAANASFTLRDDDITSPVSQDISPRDSANALAQNVVMAYGSGAAGYEVSLNPQEDNQMDPIKFSSNSDDIHQLVPWERATAFAAANHLLGSARFVKELFSDTPAVYAALFQSGDSSLAAIWSNQDDEGKLKLKLSGAVLIDAEGNQIDQADKNGDLKIPLCNALYYLQANVSPDVLARALRAASIDGMASVRAQILPLTQLPDGNDARQLRVRLQNIMPHSCSGIVSLDAPDGWKLASDSQQFVLQPGESHVYGFAVTQARENYSYAMRVKVRVNNGVTGSWSWRVEPPVATADNWTSKSTFTLDGSLDDWRDASWMTAKNDMYDRKAAVTIRWDNQNLYIAAKVNEPRFTIRPNTDNTYNFWNGDAIQLGFGWREEPWMHPSSGNFRDTDFGFLLTPYAQLTNGSIDGRVLMLWNHTTPFGEVNDKVRWGGAISGANCRIIFDAKKKEATYEAVIPLSALGNLNPQSRIATLTTPDQPIRFSWIAHTFDGVPVQWSKTAGVFPWWGNSGSFLPAEKGYLAAQTMLGFSLRGDIVKASAKVVPPTTGQPEKNTPTLPPISLQQPRQPVKPMNPVPPQNQVPSLPNPVPLQPIPSNLLPPAPPGS